MNTQNTIGSKMKNFFTKTTKDILTLKEEFVGNAIFAMIIIFVILILLYF